MARRSDKFTNDTLAKDAPAKRSKVGKPNSINHDAEFLYMREIEFVPLLSAQQEIELGRRVQHGDDLARQRMIESNLRLVVKIARKYYAPEMALMDLVEEGNIGLMQAVDKYDPEKGFRFSTYASWWIRHEIECSIMNQSRTVRLPIHVIRELNKYKRASYQLVQRLQHEPNLRELSDCTEHSIDDMSHLLSLDRPSQSVDAPLGEKGIAGGTLLDLVENKRAENPMALLQQSEVHDHLIEWLAFLDDRQREIIERRFGLCQPDDHGLGENADENVGTPEAQTLEQVAQAVGLTRERVRQIQIQALDKLHAILVKNGFAWEDLSALKNSENKPI